MFEKIKRFFNIKLYSKEQVYKFCEKGVISADEYRDIVREDEESK